MRVSARSAARFLFAPAAPPELLAASATRPSSPTLQPAPAWSGPVPAFGTVLGRDAATLDPFDVDAGLLAGIAGWSRDVAMTVPTINRARDILCSTVAALPIAAFRQTWNAATSSLDLAPLPPVGWAERPDPNRTRAWLLSWTVDDLIFRGAAYWRVSGRYATGYPSAFEWMPAAEVELAVDGESLRWTPSSSTTDAAGAVLYVAARDVVQFLSPIEALLTTGARAIRIAVNLDAAAERFSTVEMPSGWLQQESGEPMGGPQLDEIAARWSAARRANSTGALNQSVTFHESTYDPEKLQLVGAREFQSAELARLANVPAFLVGAPAGDGMTYVNAQETRAAVIDWGALPYVQCIEQTLSGPSVLPAGTLVRLDTTAWLRSPFTTAANPADNPPPDSVQPSPTSTIPT